MLKINFIKNKVTLFFIILCIRGMELHSQTVTTYSILSTAYNQTSNTFFPVGTVDNRWFFTRIEDMVFPNNPASVINYPNNPTYVVPNAGNNSFPGIIPNHSINNNTSTTSLGLKLITYRTYFDLPNLNLTSNRYSLSFKMSADDAVDNVKLNGTQKAQFLDANYNNIPGIDKPYLLNVPICDTDFVSGQNYIDVTMADAGGSVGFYAEITLSEVANVLDTIITSNSNIEICGGETITLSAATSSNYNWNTGATTQSIIVTPNITSTYSVSSNTNSTTCISSTLSISVFTVSVITSEDVQLPNVFSPNDDDINDRFYFSDLMVCDSYEFEIFDRWGLSILKTSDTKQNFWDGRTTSGEKVSDGTYFYILKTNNKSYRGTVTVFR